MRLNIRVGNALTDLEGFNRVAVESIGARLFLVGVRNSGKRIALFAVRKGIDSTDVLEAIAKTMDANRQVVQLSRECVDIDDDPAALDELEKSNTALENAREQERVNNLGSSGALGTPTSGRKYPTRRNADG